MGRKLLTDWTQNADVDTGSLASLSLNRLALTPLNEGIGQQLVKLTYSLVTATMLSILVCRDGTPGEDNLIDRAIDFAVGLTLRTFSDRGRHSPGRDRPVALGAKSSIPRSVFSSPVQAGSPAKIATVTRLGAAWK